MSTEPLTDRQLAAAFFGWLATGFSTWLLAPAFKGVLEGPEAPMESTTLWYFLAWLGGDALHLTALLLEEVGAQQWGLYVIIAAFEFVILLTLMWKAHLFRYIGIQKPLPKNTANPETTLAMTGFGLSVVHARKRKASSKTWGFSDTFWMVFWTIIFALIGVTLWVLLALKRVVPLDPPKAQQWPHDTQSTIAFVFGVAGFFCWTAPRLYVLLKKKDDISTASVIVGVGAHLFNLTESPLSSPLNIATLNFVDVWSAAASSPFFLTSVVCIILDLIRLYRKPQLDKEAHQKLNDHPLHGALHEVLRRAQPQIIDADSKGDLVLPEGAAPSKRQLRRVDEATEDLKFRAKELVDRLVALRSRVEKMHVARSDKKESIRKEWESICEREYWNKENGKELLPAMPSRREKGSRKDAFGAYAYEAENTLNLVGVVLGHDSKRYKDLKKGMDTIRLRVIKEKDYIVKRLKTIEAGGHSEHSPPTLSGSTVSPTPSHSSQSLGHHRRHHSLSSSSRSSSSHSESSETEFDSSAASSSDEEALLGGSYRPQQYNGTNRGRCNRRW
ncbi:uncharacterized protein JCM6883_000859 [Sporobolomyces salmoneus]|uniref:uncharacterized protein n=1 Tax=Sporobolomyces salmoneus TaxID=183962 RepID=UPI0031704453